MSFKLLQHYKLTTFIETDEDVVHRKYFCVNNHLVSLVELLLEAEENFLLSVYSQIYGVALISKERKSHHNDCAAKTNELKSKMSSKLFQNEF